MGGYFRCARQCEGCQRAGIQCLEQLGGDSHDFQFNRSVPRQTRDAHSQQGGKGRVTLVNTNTHTRSQ